MLTHEWSLVDTKVTTGPKWEVLKMDSRTEENEPSECGCSEAKPVNLFSMIVKRDRPVFF